MKKELDLAPFLVKSSPLPSPSTFDRRRLSLFSPSVSILRPPSRATPSDQPLALSHLNGIIRSTILPKERGLAVVVVRHAPTADDSAGSSFPGARLTMLRSSRRSIK